jgi:glutamine synthetase
MFLGDVLTGILDAIESGAEYHGPNKSPMEIGVTVLPHFPKDTTDRNRTSPFAFTGNKFEFRMLGSTFSIAESNIALNTAVAESLRQFADILKKGKDFKADLAALIKKTIHEHKRIVFNGNNYSDEWVAEAKKRGLSNHSTTIEALHALIEPSNIELLSKHGVYTETEMRSRYEIHMESYCKTITIEALTMLDMVNCSIIPACVSYQNELAKLLKRKKECGDYDSTLEERMLSKISKLCSSLLNKLDVLEEALQHTQDDEDIKTHAEFCRNNIFTAMAELRLTADELEAIVAKRHWPFPSYGDLLYSVL